MIDKPYQSPSTPGLAVAFKDFVVEMVCLNSRRDLTPRFWSVNGYWRRRYATESRAFQRFAKGHDDLDDPLTQRAIIDVVRERGLRTLLVKDRALQYLDRQIRDRRAEIVKGAEASAAKDVKVAEGYMERNAAITSEPQRSRVDRLRGIESG